MNQCWNDARVRFLEPFDKNDHVKVWLGKRFIFIDMEAVEDVSTSDWVTGLEEQWIGNRAIVSLDNSVTYSLNKIKVTPQPIPELKLETISSDRRMYRSEKDRIHLFIASPRQKNSNLKVSVSESGLACDEYSIDLDRFGLGSLVIEDLPAGNYKATIDEGTDGKWRRSNDVSCEFSVCEFKLVPLVANLTSFTIRNHPTNEHQEVLLATVQISRLGEPFTGKARFDVYAGSEPLGSQALNVTDGEASIKFPFRGKEELSFQIQLEKHPDLTATVIIPCSNKSERRQQDISTIGSVVQGSLVSTAGSTNVRGIHLRENGIDIQPLHMICHETGKIEFESYSSVENLVVQCIPISTNGLENKGCSKQFGSIPIAHSVSLTTKAAVNLVGVGCFVDGEPWEAWGFAITNSSSSIEIDAPQESESNTPNRLTIRSKKSAKAYVVVRDSRIAAGHSTESKFAEQILDYIGDHLSSYSIERPQRVADLQPLTLQLVCDGLISMEQLRDAKNLARQTSGKESEMLVKLGYITNTELCKAWADLLGFPFVDINSMDIEEDIIELMPESVARENNVLPLSYSNGELVVAIHDPSDVDTIEKLRFILNRKIGIRVATREKIVSAINRFYGQIEGETADSILQEFCDTAVDFNDTMELHDRKRASMSADAESRQNQLIRHECATIFARLVNLDNGKAEIDLPGLAANHEYEVSVLAVSGIAGFDWVEATTRFTFNSFPYAEFCLPDQCYVSDGACGKLMFGTKSGQARVTIELPEGKQITKVVKSKNRIDQISFCAKQGDYSATVEDLKNNESATATHVIQNPESIATYSRCIRVLQPGESFPENENSTIRSIEFARQIRNPIRDMASAICSYEHCCCEQTAAKIRSATYLYLLSEPESEDRFLASRSIVKGVDRLEQMQISLGRFYYYPNRNSTADEYWNSLVCQHMRFLNLLVNRDLQSDKLKSAVRSGIEIANSRIESQSQLTTAGDHYLTFRFSKNNQRRKSSLKSLVQMYNDSTHPTTAVQARARNAYIAAAFLSSRKAELRNKGLEIANWILRQADTNDRLYSTLDSTAALTMLTEMKSLGCNETGQVRINDELFEKTNAEIRNLRIRNVEAVGKPLMIRYQESKRIRWSDFKNNVSINVSTSKNGNHRSNFKSGEKFDLSISLQEEYKFGDHALIYLPDSIAHLSAGGQVRQLNVDFEGECQFNIPLVVTSISQDNCGDPAPHHFAVCVRNMYDEERIGNSGWLKINCQD